MGIWVRSQDKETLLKSKGFKIFSERVFQDDEDVPFNEKVVETGRYLINSVDGDECGCLGVYESKERAIHVLYNIQGFIITGITKSGEYVFQMPEN